MPVRSLSSSVVRWPQRKEVHNAVVSWAEQLLKARTDVLRVGYFGSYARDEWGPGSDLDVLVVLDDSTVPFGERVLGTEILDLPVSVDLLVYTVTEFRNLADRNPKFYRHLTGEIVWLCQREPAT